MSKQNWFGTLNESLESEGLLHTWDPIMQCGGIPYDCTTTWTYEDGTRYGHYITIYRNNKGMYERPVHYARG